MGAPEKKPVSRDQFPENEFNEIISTNPHAMCRLRVARLAAGGKMATLRGMAPSHHPIPLRLVRQVPELIAEMHGGGRFRISVWQTDYDERFEGFPTWDESIEGAPRPMPDSVRMTILYNEESGQLEVVAQDGHGRPQQLIGGTVATHIRSVQNALAPQAQQPSYGAPPPWAPQPPQQPIAAMPAGSAPPSLPAPTYHMGQLQPPPSDLGWTRIPITVATQPAPDQWAWVREAYRATYQREPENPASTQIAMGWQQQQAAATAQERANTARLEAMLSATNAQLAAFREDNARLAAKLEAEKADAERRRQENERELRFQREQQATQAQIAEMRSMIALQAQSKPQPSALEGLAPFAPVIGAVLSAHIQAQASARQAEVELQRHARSAEASAAQKQNEMLVALATRREPTPPSLMDQLAPMLAVMGPMVTPILVKWMDNQDPSKVAELRSYQSQESQAFLMMLVNFIKEMNPADDQPWWAPALMSVLEKMGGGMMALAAQQQLAAGGGAAALPPPAMDARSQVVQERPQPRQAPVERQQAPTPPAAPQQQSSGLDAVLATLAQSNPVAAQQTALVFNAMAESEPPDAAWFTNEWMVLIFNLHAKVDADRMAELFVDHVNHCRTFGILPALLADVFKSPADVLGRGLFMMPVGLTDRSYVENVITLVAEQIMLDESEADAELDADPSNDEGAEDDPRGLEDDEDEEAAAAAE